MRNFTLTCRAAMLVAGCVLPVALAPAAHAQKLTTTQFPDGTGSIGLAPGWHINGAYNGAVGCDGPNHAAVVLKMPWVIMIPGNDMDGYEAAQNQPHAQVGDYKTALREVLLKKAGGGILKSVRARPVGNLESGAPAYLLFYEFTQDGVPYTGMGYFAALGYGQQPGFWQLYSSAIIAPKAQFAKMAPQMIAMWKSWRPNGERPREGSASAVWDKIIQDRKDSYEDIQKEFRKQL